MHNYLDSKNAQSIEILPEYLKIEGFTPAALLVYSVIMQFTRKGNGKRFTGSLVYLAQYAKVTKRGVIKVLQGLVERGYVVKEEYSKPGSDVKRQAYRGRSTAELAAEHAERKHNEAKEQRQKANRAAAKTQPRAKYIGREYKEGELTALIDDLGDFETPIAM